MVSALPIGAVFFLISIFISFFDEKIFNYKDKYNLILLISGLLMILKNIFLNLPENIINQNIRMNIWLDLANWIPFFIIFIYCQIYLKTTNQRVIFSKFVIAGSFPFFISCILQSWFKLYGPFEILNGLIIWFQKPIGENHIGVTGLFSNQNYAGLWLTAILPLLIAEIRISKFKSKIFLYFISLIDIYLIFLTTSKNAFFGLIIILIMLYGFRSKILKVISGIFASFILFSKFFDNIYFENISYMPFEVYDKVSSFNFFTSSRFEIFNIAFKLISKKPLFGWGKSLFPDLYISNGGQYSVEHTHSMPLEIAFNYGIPVALLLTGLISLLIINSLRKINSTHKKNHNDFIDKCWVASTLIIAISHLNDITYYDGKISILIWIFLTGTKCISNTKETYERFEKEY